MAHLASFRSLSLAAAAAVAILSTAAHAHTSSLGYEPGSNAGEVIFWAGSYEHGGSVLNEGTFTLTGIDTIYNAVVNANIAPTSVKPSGLVDGTNNFFWAEDGFGGYTFPVNTDPIIFGLGISHWQGISFSGLAPGTYSFTCGLTCGTTQQWESLSGGAVQVTLTGRDIGNGAVPEPSTWATVILGFGAIGALLRRRRKAIPRHAVA